MKNKMISIRRIDNAINFACNKYLRENELQVTGELTNLFKINKEACKDIFNLAEKYFYYTIKDPQLLKEHLNALEEYIKIHIHHSLQNFLEKYFEVYDLFN